MVGGGLRRANMTNLRPIVVDEVVAATIVGMPGRGRQAHFIIADAQVHHLPSSMASGLRPIFNPMTSSSIQECLPMGK